MEISLQCQQRWPTVRPGSSWTRSGSRCPCRSSWTIGLGTLVVVQAMGILKVRCFTSRIGTLLTVAFPFRPGSVTLLVRLVEEASLVKVLLQLPCSCSNDRFEDTIHGWLC